MKFVLIIMLGLLLLSCDDDDNSETSMTLPEFAHEFAKFKCDTFYECCHERGGFDFNQNFTSYEECYEELKAEYENGKSEMGIKEDLEGLIAYFEVYTKYYNVGCDDTPNYEYRTEILRKQKDITEGTYPVDQSCVLYSQCIDGYSCINDTCQEVLIAGEECEYNSDCKTGYFCNLVCEPNVVNGDPCVEIDGDLECPSSGYLFCDLNDNYCKLRHPEQDACTVKEECLTHDCSEDGICIWNKKLLHEEICNNY
jgi:hypothetical protein